MPDVAPIRVLEIPEVALWPSADEGAALRRPDALEALEAGSIIFLPELAFRLEESERALLDPTVADRQSKNISFDPTIGVLAGTRASGADRQNLAELLERYHGHARALLTALFPSYAPHLLAGRASFRPLPIGERPNSWRKDDRRLHIDSFPRRPAQGRRILRVFSNINSAGEPRVWVVGEPFPAVVHRFTPRTPRQIPGAGWALERLGLTKGRRTDYDRLMLGLHDEMKADDGYQLGNAHRRFVFPGGSSWIVFTDMVPHAAIAGQHALEQTFYLPIEAMQHPERSPLRILERMMQRSLAGTPAA